MLQAVLPLLAVGLLSPPPPPPSPSPPGVGCSGESVFRTTTGSVDISFGSGTALSCSFVLRTSSTSGVTVSPSVIQLTASGTAACSAENAHLRVYDGTTTFGQMLASYTCNNAWSVGSAGSDVLVVFTADATHSGRFTFSWQPSTNTCGNGVCELSADEYETVGGCAADCAAGSRGGALPALTLQYHDTK